MDLRTIHALYFESAAHMAATPDNSIDLVVTSPPYPMIEMWDASFSSQDRNIETALATRAETQAFEHMHRVLDRVWDETCRVLKDGGFACINIGDAARTISGRFALYPNHARVITYLTGKGLTALPVILWRKQTNAPNKFMGSGMLPAGAYVTLEHEYILIFRKGGKRTFTSKEAKLKRHRSAIFWEERNNWFSDVWMDLKGTVQNMKTPALRKRSGAFPFELPYRLVNMFSVKGDTVLDPFCGIGTTLQAAMAAGRNSIGYEIETEFRETIHARMMDFLPVANARIAQRLENHCRFVSERMKKNGVFKYQNRHYGFPVITSQERELLCNDLTGVRPVDGDRFEVMYSDLPQSEFQPPWSDMPADVSPNPPGRTPRQKKKAPAANAPLQQELLK